MSSDISGSTKTLNEDGTLSAVVTSRVESHKEMYLRDPEKAHYWDTRPGGGKGLTPCLLLTYTGRKSGERFCQPLIYGKDKDCFVLVASKGGAPSHPAWYLNIVNNPDVELQVGIDHYAGKARTLGPGPERDRIWEYMADLFPPYIDYQSRTDRLLPVVLIDVA